MIVVRITDGVQWRQVQPSTYDKLFELGLVTQRCEECPKHTHYDTVHLRGTWAEIDEVIDGAES